MSNRVKYKSEVMERFTQWLLWEMQKRQMKRIELAAELALDHSTISYKFETNRWRPDQMMSIFNLFDASADTIFTIMRGKKHEAK